MAKPKKKSKSNLRRFLPSRNQFLIGLFVMGLLGVTFIFAAVRAVEVPAPSDVSQAQATILYYDDGVTELGRLGESNRVSLTLTDIPVLTQQAVLAAEDRDFYEHGGFSVRGIVRAFFSNATSSTTAGGSTITQQYAKNAYLSQEQTIKRKVREVILSVKLETMITKEKILENYLNTIYFGRKSYGIETGANAYFGKAAKDLTLAESAFLASIIQAPNGLAPEKNIEGLMARWNYTLDGMVEKGWITQEERVLQVFPSFLEYKNTNSFAGPVGHLVEQSRQELFRLGITEDQINRAGLRVTTTFNKQAQDSAISAVIEEGPTEGTEGLRIGLAAVRPGTGEVVAIYGGDDYLEDQFNNATQAIGQAGSTFKPFTLAAALENDFSLGSVFSGMNKTKVGTYEVVNYGSNSYGEWITLLLATENSVNSAYVQLADQVGLETVYQAAIRAGVPAGEVGMMPNLAFTLGTASPNVVDIANGYSTFAARGLQTDLSYIKVIAAKNGDVLYQHNPQPVQAFSTDVADTVSYALKKVVEVGTGRAAQRVGRPVAGKTGTTNDNKSALFAGYTPDLAAAVMFTKDGPNGESVSLSGTGGMRTVTGGSFPARIFTAFMRGALEGTPAKQFGALPANQPDGSTPTGTPIYTGIDPALVGQQVTVPSLIISLADARAAAAANGIVLVESYAANVDQNATLYVINQSVPAGTVVMAGTVVGVTISNSAASP
jgi:membrane peptidoglycan carboxypeptidase